MQLSKLTDLNNKQVTHRVFQDDIYDDEKLNNIQVKTSHFVRLGMKETEIRDSTLTQSLFEDCYMRKAHFVNVDLTGSTFRNCNLEKTTMQGCNLRFCTFENTRLNRDEIISCLPIQPNLKRALARNLRKNFEMLGDKESADIFMKIEISASEDELWEIYKSKTDYYKERYVLLD